MRSFRFVLAAILIGTASARPALADIYSYTDADGSLHYSNVPTDERYVLLLRESPGAAARAHDAGRRLAERRRWEAEYASLIEQASRKARVPADLVRALITVESAFDAQAVSAKGAQGLMQLLPATAARYGVKRPFDPAENVRGGARYLSDLLKRFDNDLALAVAAYNAGAEAVERYGRAVPPYAETVAYVPAVLGIYRKLVARNGAHDYQPSLRDPT
jgi:soluble lytic murein transglycosylase-like protein